MCGWAARWGVAALLAGGIAAAASAQELRLADGRVVVPAGIVALAPPDAATAVALRDPAATGLDRHGRVRAQLRNADGAWLQARLVGEGCALVAPAADVPDAVLVELLGFERAAREAGRGRWADGGLGPFPAETVTAPAGSFVLVRGTVRAVTRRQDLTYLDFGADWRQDFTVRADTRSLNAFARAGLDVAALAGKRILVRGWLFENAGPMVELVHPLQIEVEE
jgi:hypothetical protein